MTSIKLVSVDFFEKLLSLWQGFLSLDRIVSADGIYEEMLRNWWQDKGESLADKLKEMTREERNICKNWDLTEEVKELIQKYYIANRLLVDCMVNTPGLGSEIMEDLTSSLFLSIAEIEKRRIKSSD